MAAIKVGQKPVNEETVDVFELDDVTYTMPKHPPASLSLEFADRLRWQIAEAAAAWLLEEVIGADGYRALISCKTLDRSDLNAIMGIVRKHVLGPMEEAGKA